MKYYEQCLLRYHNFHNVMKQCIHAIVITILLVSPVWLNAADKENPSVKPFADKAVKIAEPPQLPEKGGVVMTFDDRNFGDWVKAIPLFDEFNVKATFFISGDINQQAINTIQKLIKHGHAIGIHTVHHIKAIDYFKKNTADEYFQNEINPQLVKLQSIGIIPTSFAYPMSNNNKITDKAILKKFRHIRTGKGLAQGKK